MSLPEAWRGHAAMLAFSALVAGSFSLGALIANEIDPAALNAARFAIAAVLLGTVAHLAQGWSRAQFRAPWRYVLLGGLFAFYFVMMFEGLKTAPAVSAAAVFTLIPLMAACFGWLVLRQVTTPRMALALLIGATGALWVIFRADLRAIGSFQIGPGETTYFWGCVAHALYAALLVRLNRGEPSVVFTFAVLVAGCAILTLAGWPAIRATDWLALPPLVWGTLLYLAIFASAASFTLLQYASMRLKAARVMAYTYLTPSFVILWEIALGKAPPPLMVGLGVVLSALALAILLKADPPRATAVPVPGTVRTPPG